MSGRDIPVLDAGEQPRRGVLFDVRGEVRSRDLRPLAREFGVDFNDGGYVVSYKGDYVGWMRDPNQDDADFPTLDAPTPDTPVWQDLARRVDEELPLRRVMVYEEEVQEHEIRMPERGRVRVRAPVPRMREADLTRIGTSDVRLPGPGDELTGGGDLL